MIDGDVEKLVLAVLRTVISRPCITENMTADIRRLCVAILCPYRAEEHGEIQEYP